MGVYGTITSSIVGELKRNSPLEITVLSKLTVQVLSGSSFLVRSGGSEY
jgi:hypothetical protein